MTQTATVVVAVNNLATLPKGSAAYASTLLTLTDSSGAQFTVEVDGQETPAWTAEFPGIAQTTGGTGTVVAQAQDASGKAIGSPVTQSYTDLAPGTGTGSQTFPAPTGLTISLTSP